MTGSLATVRPLVLAVSPYHLTGREPAAMASLLLADRVVTMVPTPPGEPDPTRARRTAERVPRFVELVEAWSWSVPLWREGVVCAHHDGDDPALEVHRVATDITERDELTDLRPFLRHAPVVDDRHWLDAIARDLLKGGPDPSLVVPVVAAMDRLCAHAGLVAVRSTPTSLAEQAESRLGRTLFRVAAPALVACSADRMLEMREALEAPLRALRRAILGAMTDDEDHLRDAAAVLSRAFDAARDDLTRPEDDDDLPRVRAAMVSIEGVRLPTDAALRSIVAAARSALGRSTGTPFAPADDALGAIIVRVIGR
ncbi:MAG: hypothetical protein R3B49_03430 [Phycisphaerales bacterium]